MAFTTRQRRWTLWSGLGAVVEKETNSHQSLCCDQRMTSGEPPTIDIQQRLDLKVQGTQSKQPGPAVHRHGTKPPQRPRLARHTRETWKVGLGFRKVSLLQTKSLLCLGHAPCTYTHFWVGVTWSTSSYVIARRKHTVWSHRTCKKFCAKTVDSCISGSSWSPVAPPGHGIVHNDSLISTLCKSSFCMRHSAHETLRECLCQVPYRFDRKMSCIWTMES